MDLLLRCSFLTRGTSRQRHFPITYTYYNQVFFKRLRLCEVANYWRKLNWHILLLLLNYLFIYFYMKHNVNLMDTIVMRLLLFQGLMQIVQNLREHLSNGISRTRHKMSYCIKGAI